MKPAYATVVHVDHDRNTARAPGPAIVVLKTPPRRGLARLAGINSRNPLLQAHRKTGRPRDADCLFLRKAMPEAHSADRSQIANPA